MIRKIVLAIAAVLTITGSATAADPVAPGVAQPISDSQMAAAIDLLDALQLKAVLTQTLVESVLPTYVERLRKAYPTISDSAVKKFQDIFTASLAPDLDALVRVEAPIYAEHFSEAELRTLATFYRTPAGQMFLKGGPGEMKPGKPPAGMKPGNPRQFMADMKTMKEFPKTEVGAKFLSQSPAIVEELKPITIRGLNATGKLEAIHAVDELKKQGDIT